MSEQLGERIHDRTEDTHGVASVPYSVLREWAKEADEKDAEIAELRIDAQRIMEWLNSSPRKPAHLAFTSGAERQVADVIEMAIREKDAEIARLREEVEVNNKYKEQVIQNAIRMMQGNGCTEHTGDNTPNLTEFFDLPCAFCQRDRITALKELLGECEKAIASLDEGALGYGGYDAGGPHWPFRDELLTKIQEARG